MLGVAKGYPTRQKGNGTMAENITNNESKQGKAVDYIRKSITSTLVTGFVLNPETMQAEVKTINLEGALTKERAESKARKQLGNILVTSVEQHRSYYQLDRETAMQFVTDERVNKDDIQLGETGTTVYYLRLVKAGKSETVAESITFEAPMTESRAFGAARRATPFDILPFAAEQNRTCKFLARAKFFELAEPCESEGESESESVETESEN